MPGDDFSDNPELARGAADGYNSLRSMEIPSRIERLAVMHPSGNLTAVVFDPILDAPRQELNDAIMEAWKAQRPDEPEIEQCCFFTEPHDPRALVRMEMFGEEFCGNASRSVIQLLTEGKDAEGFIEASGTEKLLRFSVKDGDITVDMPLPNKAQLSERVPEGSLVHLDGMTHLVMVSENVQLLDSVNERLNSIVQNNEYNAKRLPAFGVTSYDSQTGQANFAVWVNEINTFFDETACGSGTCAIGVATALAGNEDVELNVVQPSGETIVTRAQVNREGNVTGSSISGKVTSLYDGEFNLTAH